MRLFMAVQLALALAVGGPANADVTDWCIPADDGCMGPERLTPGALDTPSGFNTCEERCDMINPVPVRDMNATLFDVVCAGDSSSRSYRMFFHEFVDANGSRQAVMIREAGPEKLERC